MPSDMDLIRIVGGRPLGGAVAVSGSKNGSLPLLAATLLMEGECVLHRIPLIDDIATMLEILRALGLEAERNAEGTVTVRNHGIAADTFSSDLAERMRASFWVAGPLLARLRSATVPLPGGCAIGSRPVDYIIQGFAALGVRAEIEHGLMKATADRLPGGTVFLDARYRSPGATFNVMMLSVLADGATTIENASTDPEVVSCAEFLNAMGARISGIGGATLHIEGVPALRGCEFTGIADRIEAGTYLLAAAATRGDVTVEQANPAHLDFVLAKLEEAGLAITRCDDAIRVQAPDRARAVDITTGPFPLFPTDLQSPMVVLLSLADGTSIVQETIYDGRLTYLDELRRMGAQSRMVDQTAIITGVERLTGASIHAHDMRAGAALVVAALAAEGESRISGLHFIQRGYQDLEAKLRSLGADLRVQA